MQETLEQAIRAVTQEDARVVGSGRTDAGAHALGQVVAFSTESSLPTHVLCRAINAHLPPDVAVTSVSEVEPSFHPRFDASSRVYRYLIWNRTVRSPFWRGRSAHVKALLDDQAMNAAAAALVGRHDFTAFVPANQAGGREREVFRACCIRQGDLVTVEIEASGFMRQMIRSIVGTLVQVGLGAIDPSAFRRILLSRDRAQAGITMPAEGLCLVGVSYRAPAGPAAMNRRTPSEEPAEIEEMV